MGGGAWRMALRPMLAGQRPNGGRKPRQTESAIVFSKTALSPDKQSLWLCVAQRPGFLLLILLSAICYLL
jgi:hypothetical protein